MNKLYVTILAGGLGKRMQSELPKVLHSVKGEAMIVRLLKQVIVLNPTKILIVVGKFGTIIKEEIEKHIGLDIIEYVNQPDPRGTGDAVKCTLEYLPNETVDNIILNGDVPLLRSQTIKEIYQHFLSQQSKLLITSINLKNPQGNGRIIVNNDIFEAIVEEKDCNANQKMITLVNCGIYVCSSDTLKKYIPAIKPNNAQNEYYITDLVILAKKENKIDLFTLESHKEIEIFNINTKQQLEFAELFIIDDVEN